VKTQLPPRTWEVLFKLERCTTPSVLKVVYKTLFYA